MMTVIKTTVVATVSSSAVGGRNIVKDEKGTALL
jgi:hypothetical protein